ncbi:uncharacterized protein LOC122080185 [Macadamia integrifolia]|uniref:uncharacterized protein LOC122080185 n=1 Tax=Macadamia integrifolia TaxID=60698 RepID=UPI001C4FD981|nr:uncharacterized protein LOC122080185 [Macadamia integrifolia]
MNSEGGTRIQGVLVDGRCLFRAISHGACLRSGKEAPDETRERELADELRARMFKEIASAIGTSADDLKDSPIKCAGTPSTVMDLVVIGDKQCKLTEVGVSVGEEFQSAENVVSKGTTVKPDAVLGVTASMGHLDLSVAPPDSCDTVKGTCSELPIKAASETLLDITNSASTNHATVLHEEKTKIGMGPVLLESSNETVQERSSDTYAGRSSCINAKEYGNSSRDYVKASTLLPMDNSSQNQCQQNHS